MANGDVVNAVRVRSSQYLFGNYEFKTVSEAGQISREFLTLVVKSHDDPCSVMLSFKHITKIEFLDNSEGMGAGLLVYVNDFMAKKLENCLELDSNAFFKFRLINGSNNSFILFDIVNDDPTTISAIHHVLRQSSEFRKTYVQQRLKDKSREILANNDFINLLKYDDWKKTLAFLHKDFIVEELIMRNEKGEEVKYNCGHIINLLPHEKNFRKRHQQRSITSVIPGETSAKIPRIPRNARHVEINLDDDDEHDEPTNKATSSIDYKPEGKSICKIEPNDLQTLNQTIMINDTIIDFYLNYIFYKLIPIEMREKIFIFNSFFYSKLCKGVNFQVTHKYPKQRPKKLQDNYTSLKSWTKGVNLFEKDYVVVPINEDAHWYLAVIVNPKAGIVHKDDSTPAYINTSRAGPVTNSITPTIPIFIFDSLIDKDDANRHLNVMEFLSHYMSMEYKEKKEELSLPGCGYRQHQFQMICPTGMPQQKNHYDCGIFLLMFAEVFLLRALKPEECTKTSKFDQLFKWPQLKGKREEIKKIILNLPSETGDDINHSNGSEPPVSSQTLLTPLESESIKDKGELNTSTNNLQSLTPLVS